jgi:hypothetical protein
MKETGRVHHYNRTMTRKGGGGGLTKSRGVGTKNRTGEKGLLGEDAVLVSLTPGKAELFPH